jgi:hypothetical protein
MQVLTIVISVAGSVISGMTLYFFQRFFKRVEKADEERDKAKAKENVLILKGLNAVGQLTVANAIAIRDGKQNGETHAALETYEKVDREIYDYLLEQNSHKNK